jgi:hypothetical protein
MSEDSRPVIGGKFSPRFGAKTAFFAGGTHHGNYRFHDGIKIICLEMKILPHITGRGSAFFSAIFGSAFFRDVAFSGIDSYGKRHHNPPIFKKGEFMYVGRHLFTPEMPDLWGHISG